MRSQRTLHLTFHLEGTLHKAWLRQLRAVWTLRENTHTNHTAGTEQGRDLDPRLFRHPRLQVQGSQRLGSFPWGPILTLLAPCVEDKKPASC